MGQVFFIPTQTLIVVKLLMEMTWQESSSGTECFGWITVWYQELHRNNISRINFCDSFFNTNPLL